MAFQWRYLLPAPLRQLPADLVAVVGWTIATVVVATVPVLRETPLRILFGVPVLIFVPGYVFVALLFPEDGDPPTVDDESDPLGTDASSDATVLDTIAFWRDDSEQQSVDGESADPFAVDQRRGIDGIERAALSFGLSIAIVPSIGLVLDVTPLGIRLVPFLIALGLFTVGCAVGAALRRQSLSPDERYVVPYRRWLGIARTEVFQSSTSTDVALNLLLAASLLFAVGSVGYVVMIPSDSERFTEFYLLTQGGDDLVASDYPEQLTEGEEASVVVGIENNEHESVDYTVVTQLQRVEVVDNETNVLERRELDRLHLTLSHDETWRHEHGVEPSTTGERLRLQYLLYRGDAPAEPTRENAYRRVHLWVTVDRDA